MAKGEGRESGNQDQQMRLLDVVGLRMAAITMEHDMLGRYVSNPDNLPEIYSFVRTFLASMSSLPNAYDPAMCPADWMHKQCRCVPPM